MHDLTIRYGYAVQDDEGNDFNQQEQSDGDQVSQAAARHQPAPPPQITGQYSVVMADCRIQTVTYSVRPETGFVVRSRFVSLHLLAKATGLYSILALCPGRGFLL